jgi:hypothetical protein
MNIISNIQKAALALAVVAFGAQANELDPTPAQRPTALVVRTDAAGKSEVFKADLVASVANDAQALAAAQSLSDANKVQPKLGSELDNDSSSEAWYYWGGYYGYSYAYSYRSWGYNYYYYPTYSYCYGPYTYSYYWRY